MTGEADAEADSEKRGRRRGGRAPTIAELMRLPGYWIRTDTRIGVTWAIFIERALAMAPVVDGRGRPVGTLWRGDLAAAMLDDEPTQPGASAIANGADEQSWLFRRSPPVSELTLVADIMRQSVFTIPITATVEEAQARLAATGSAELVVVDGRGAMVGLVDARSLLAASELPPPTLSQRARPLRPRRLDD